MPISTDDQGSVTELTSPDAPGNNSPDSWDHPLTVRDSDSDYPPENEEAIPQYLVPIAKATPQEAKSYWENSPFWAFNSLSLRKCMQIERRHMELVRSRPEIAEELWVRSRVDSPGTVYTGAVVRQRKGFVGTSHVRDEVKAMVISRLSTNARFRRLGHATQFLRRLAQEMDSRQGDDRIAFSVIYGGPDTDFLKKRG